MAADGSQAGDSPHRSMEGDGGSIPGADGAAAFTLYAAEPSAIPVLIAVPHAGRTYPAALLAGMRDPRYAALKLEDRYVDLLAHEVAAATGAALLVAHAPRAMIDLNRAPDDVDWDMFAAGPGHGEGHRQGAGRSTAPRAEIGSYVPARRARTGLGLIPRRLPGLGELWKHRHERAELDRRLAAVHRPYHACLAEALAGLRGRWGAALLVDLHSMPPLPSAGVGVPPAGFVLGDRFGATCDGGLVAAAFAYFARQAHPAAHNRPYAGGYALERHADPAHGLHALQLEIDRTRYLEPRMIEPGDGFAATVATLAGLVSYLAGRVADLGSGQRWADAAE